MMGVIAPARQLLSKEKLLAHVLRGLEADLASKNQLQSECLEKQKDLDAQHATVAALATTTEGAVVQPGTVVMSTDNPASQIATYKARIELSQQHLNSPKGQVLNVGAGMQIVAEIHQGHRTVLEYLLSPVSKAVQEVGREK